MITCDTREGFSDRTRELIAELPEIYLDKCPEFEFKCLGQDRGDYLIENDGCQICIERKSMADFANTYHSLKDRLHKMRGYYERVGLLLEGNYVMRNNQIYLLEGSEFVARMQYSTFSNFMMHQNSLHTYIFNTMNFDETFYRLIEIHNYLPKLDAPSALKCGNSTEWMMMLPGIGNVAVQKMKNKYATPIDAINNLPTKAKELLLKW
jgi:ERCC4-type nuclease